MLTTLVGIIAVVAAFAPGYAWVRAAEARTLRAERSPLLEIAELGLIGAAASLFSATFIGEVSQLGFGLADLELWASQRSRYFELHPIKVLVTLSAIVAMSTFLAWGGCPRYVSQIPPDGWAGKNSLVRRIGGYRRIWWCRPFDPYLAHISGK